MLVEVHYLIRKVEKYYSFLRRVYMIIWKKLPDFHRDIVL